MQHALRAFTARDRKALQLAAETYRDNPAFDTETAIREVGVGEAVTSMLEDKGVPGVVQRTLIRPPSSQLGPLDPHMRTALIAQSDLGAKYDRAMDRASAYEMLKQRAAEAAEAALRAQESDEAPPERDYAAGRRYSGPDAGRSSRARPSQRAGDEGFGQSLGRMVLKELTGTTGRRLVRGVLGSLFKAR